MNVPSFYRYWGKAKPVEGDVVAFHLLPYHCLDVAAVGRAFLKKHTQLLNFFAATLQVRTETALAWITYWLALHDLGKFAEAFQGQRPDLLQQLLQRERDYPYTERHDSLGQWLWDKVLSVQLVEDKDLFGVGGKAKRWREGFRACMASPTWRPTKAGYTWRGLKISTPVR